MSDTPRTDAVMIDPMRDGNDLPHLARQLERELNAVNEIKAELLEALIEVCYTGHNPACLAFEVGTSECNCGYRKGLAAIRKAKV